MGAPSDFTINIFLWDTVSHGFLTKEKTHGLSQ